MQTFIQYREKIFKFNFRKWRLSPEKRREAISAKDLWRDYLTYCNDGESSISGNTRRFFFLSKNDTISVKIAFLLKVLFAIIKARQVLI